MGKTTGFLEISRKVAEYRPVEERVKDWEEFWPLLPEEEARAQGARCMDCGTPFCMSGHGCPLGNIIPEFNDLVYRGQWKRALDVLHATNNFPEFTGRLCPAPCEAACVLAINQPAVTIEQIERQIVEHGFAEGWVTARPPTRRTGKKVAVIGSGPAGLAVAQQLNRAGHTVTVFERAEVIGGLLRLGIPDFKLEKHIVQRRIDLMAAEGIIFKPGTNAGTNYPVEELRTNFDAICLTAGATQPRDLKVPGRELRGVHFAVEFLSQQNRLNAGVPIDPAERITADGKAAVILGGGDTGADCLGTVHRQGAAQVYQFELLPEPPPERKPNNPWPEWPRVLRLSAAHKEGGVRDYNILTKAFTGDEHGHVRTLQGVRLEWGPPDEQGRPKMIEIPGSEFEIETQLVLLAMGFLGPERNALISGLGVEIDGRGNIACGANYMSNVPGVFAAGDCRTGQSIVVRAIADGRRAARAIDAWLMGSSELPAPL
ncbi:MAG: glutamate synthase subunit beta [Candidatus Latescibacteria bacterium]|nr:glutamate synthase subunit beta [Candidatus Latescibacterota bacterium]